MEKKPEIPLALEENPDSLPSVESVAPQSKEFLTPLGTDQLPPQTTQSLPLENTDAVSPQNAQSLTLQSVDSLPLQDSQPKVQQQNQAVKQGEEEEKKGDSSEQQHQSNTENNAKTLLAEIEFNCQNYRFDCAGRLIAQLEKEHPEFVKNQLDKRQFDQFNNVKLVLKDLDFMTTLFEEKNEWKQESFDHGVRVMYRQLEKSPTISIMVEADLDKMPIFNLCALIYEIELFKNWVPFCEESATLKHIGLAQKVVYLKLGLPYVSHRESYLDGFGIDRLRENGTVVIVCKSIDQNPAYGLSLGVQIPGESKITRMSINYFYCEITPKSPSQLRFRAITNVNPQLRFLPGWILNFFIRKIGSYMLGKIISLATDIRNTPWEENMKKPENQVFYDWLGKNADEFFQSQATLQQKTKL